MSESQYRSAYEAGYRNGFGDGKHEAEESAPSRTAWALLGIAAGFAMGIVLHLAATGGL